jgi:hypothetical protein
LIGVSSAKTTSFLKQKIPAKLRIKRRALRYNYLPITGSAVAMLNAELHGFSTFQSIAAGILAFGVQQAGLLSTPATLFCLAEINVFASDEEVAVKGLKTAVIASVVLAYKIFIDVHKRGWL